MVALIIYIAQKLWNLFKAFSSYQSFQNNVVYGYPRLVSFVGHFLVTANEMFNYYIDLFRDTLLVLGIGLATEIREVAHCQNGR